MLETLLPWLDIITACWLAIWAACAISRLCSGQILSVNFVIPAHFLFFGLPLALDQFAGLPLLTNWPGFAAAIQDPSSCLAYDAYMALCPVLIWLIGRPKKTMAGAGAWKISSRYRPLLIVTLLAPPVALAFAPNPALYLPYASILNNPFTPDEEQFHALLSSLILLSVFGAGGLLLSARHAGVTLAALSPFLLFGIWLNGKRSIVVITILVVGAAVLPRIRRRYGLFPAIAIAGLFGLSFGIYSYTYQTQYRTLAVIDDSAVYQNTRLDFGRDLVTKMVLMHELNRPDLSILEYRGQSLLFNIVAYIPRELWQDKPWPYSVYATAAALHIKASNIGWGITSSWLDECVANLGWIGVLVAPSTLGLICSIGDRSSDAVLKIMTIAVTLLLLTVHFAAWSPLGYCWMASLWMQKRARTVKLQNRRYTQSASWGALHSQSPDPQLLLPGEV